MEETKIKGFKITFDNLTLTIENSYQLSDLNKMKSILKEALPKTIEYQTKRSISSFLNEWISKNILYKLHLFRKHTTNISFKNKIKKRYAIIYFLLSLFSKIKYGYKKIYYSHKTKKKVKQYKKYLIQHSNNIKKAYKKLIHNPNIYLIIDKEILNKLYNRILIHDKSKYSPEEFDAYRKNYYPISPREKEENIESFKLAWEHHWKNNPHHWEYRQNKQYFDIHNDDEVVDVLENIIDWMAMGYQFKDKAYKYYEQNKNKIILCDRERAFLEHVLYNILKDKEENNGRKRK